MLAPKQPALVHPHRCGWEGERGNDKNKPGHCAPHITPYLLATDGPRLKSLRSGFFGTSPRSCEVAQLITLQRKHLRPQCLIFCESVEHHHPMPGRDFAPWLSGVTLPPPCGYPWWPRARRLCSPAAYRSIRHSHAACNTRPAHGEIDVRVYPFIHRRVIADVAESPFHANLRQQSRLFPRLTG
jgi:hypothetical protein